MVSLLAKMRIVSPTLVGILVALIGLGCSALLAHLDLERQNADAQARVVARLSLIQTRLAAVVRSTFSPTDGLVHLISIQGGISPELFNALAARVMGETKAIRNITVAPDDEIRLVYPLPGNERAMGLKYASRPDQLVTVAKARETGRPILAGPVKLVQGGEALILRAPVFVAGADDGPPRYWGVISIVAYIDAVLLNAGVSNDPELAITLVKREGSGAVPISGDPSLGGQRQVAIELQVPGETWELRAAPRSGWPGSSLTDSGYFLFGIANSLLLGGLCWLVVRRQQDIVAHNRALSAEMENRRLMEKTLQEEEARFRTFFDSSPDPTWTIEDRKFTACNDAAVKLLGYGGRDELINTHPSRLSPDFQPDGEPSHAKAERMMQLAEETGLQRFEWIHRKADGTDFPAEVTLSRIMLKGRPAIYCVWRDISDRKAAEARVRESQQLLYAIVDNAPALVYVFDTTGRLILCNQQFEKAVGHRRENILGHVRQDFLPAEVAREHLANDHQVLAAGEVLSMEENNPEKDGNHVYLTVKCPLYDGSGQATAVVGISTDITERKRAEKDLLLASAVYENTADGIVITDPEGRIVSVNKAFTEITGYGPEDVTGRSPAVLKSERQDETFYQLMWSSLHGAGVWQGEIWNRRKNGEIYPEWLTITAVRSAQGDVVNYVGVFSDISAIKRSQADLERLAHFDPLTDLPNRILFRDRLSHAFERARRYGHRVAVMLLDLDGFKTVNDSLGHPVGDRLLQLVAERLLHTVRVEDTVARLGGDEFALILSSLRQGEDAIEVARKVLAATQNPFDIGGHGALVTTSIGIAVFPDDGDEPNTLIRNADAAMYKAKESGRNTYRFYQAEMTQAAQARLANERGLRRGIEKEEFEVWYQPQVSLGSGRYLGAEALVRWRDPERGLIPPGDFIPLAEQTGLIVPLGERVLHQVCSDARRWLDAGIAVGRLGINVAGPQLYRSDFVAALKAALENYRLPPETLEIEVTETFMMENPAEVRRILDAVQAMGVTTAIDDFGTGYSSLSYLKQLPIDTLKIDRAFVSNLPDDTHDIAITRAILALGRSLQFKVIAEGIETAAQRDFLQAEGCAEGQGYLFAKPMPAEQFALWLQSRFSQTEVA